MHDAQRKQDVLRLTDNWSNFLQAANVYTLNKVFLFWVSHNRRPEPPPPTVCCHPRRQKGQWGGTVKRHNAPWLSSFKVQSDSVEAHLCLSPTVRLYLWLWVREGQYTQILRLCLISTGAGVGKGLQWPCGNTDPRVKKTGRKSHGPFILAGRKSTGREKRGSVLKSALSTLVFLHGSHAKCPQTCLAPGQVWITTSRPPQTKQSESKTACSEISPLVFSHWKQSLWQSIRAPS